MRGIGRRTRTQATVLSMVMAVATASLLALAAPASAGTLLVANKADATVDLIDEDRGERVARLKTGAGPHEIAVSPDGKTAVVADYGGSRAGKTLTVVDIPSAEVTGTIALGRFTRPHGVTFLDGDTLAVTTEGAGALAVVDLAAGKVSGHVETGQRVSHMVAVAGDQAYVANIGSGSMTALDLGSLEKLGDVATGAGAEGIAVSADGAWVWVTNRDDDTVSRVDAETLKVVQTLEVGRFPIRAELTPEGRWLLVSNARGGDLTVIDTEALEVARTVDLGRGASDVEGRLFGDRFGDSSVPIGIEIAPDGKTAWIAHANADVVQILDLTTWKPTGVLATGKEPDGMAYSPVTVSARESAGH